LPIDRHGGQGYRSIADRLLVRTPKIDNRLSKSFCFGRRCQDYICRAECIPPFASPNSPTKNQAVDVAFFQTCRLFCR
jgi:hypothetical protein